MCTRQREERRARRRVRAGIGGREKDNHREEGADGEGRGQRAKGHGVCVGGGRALMFFVGTG